MGEAGILADDPRIELLAGAIIVREPTGSRHAAPLAFPDVALVVDDLLG